MTEPEEYWRHKSSLKTIIYLILLIFIQSVCSATFIFLFNFEKCFCKTGEKKMYMIKDKLFPYI